MAISCKKKKNSLKKQTNTQDPPDSPVRVIGPPEDIERGKAAVIELLESNLFSKRWHESVCFFFCYFRFFKLFVFLFLNYTT